MFLVLISGQLMADSQYFYYYDETRQINVDIYDTLAGQACHPNREQSEEPHAECQRRQRRRSEAISIGGTIEGDVCAEHVDINPYGES